MSYQKPVCDCDSELYLLENIMNSNSYKINSKGFTLKKPFFINQESWSIEFFCSECGNIYDCEFDNEKRYLRGELKREGH